MLLPNPPRPVQRQLFLDICNFVVLFKALGLDVDCIVPQSNICKGLLFTETLEAIGCRHFHTPTLLAEDLLHYYELSSTAVSLQRNEGMELSLASIF